MKEILLALLQIIEKRSYAKSTWRWGGGERERGDIGLVKNSQEQEKMGER